MPGRTCLTVEKVGERKGRKHEGNRQNRCPYGVSSGVYTSR